MHANESRAASLLPLLLLLAAGTCAAGPWRADAHNSYGWQFMTPDERVEHQRRIRSFTRYEDCKAYQTAHHAQLAERARKAGVVLVPKTESVCERLRDSGRLK